MVTQKSSSKIGQIIGTDEVVRVFRSIEKSSAHIVTQHDEGLEAGVADEFICGDDSPWDVGRALAVMEFVGCQSVVHLPSCETADLLPQEFRPQHEKDTEDQIS